jgi:hypothetical protein
MPDRLEYLSPLEMYQASGGMLGCAIVSVHHNGPAADEVSVLLVEEALLRAVREIDLLSATSNQLQRLIQARIPRAVMTPAEGHSSPPTDSIKREQRIRRELELLFRAGSDQRERINRQINERENQRQLR